MTFCGFYHSGIVALFGSVSLVVLSCLLPVRELFNFHHQTADQDNWRNFPRKVGLIRFPDFAGGGIIRSEHHVRCFVRGGQKIAEERFISTAISETLMEVANVTKQEKEEKREERR